MLSAVRFMSQQDFSNDDAFICFVLFHGSKGTVLGSDNVKVEVETITKTLSGVESLAGNPKLFFIAACQGSKNDEGITYVETPATDTWTKSTSMTKVTATSLPSGADVFIGRSSQSGYVSWMSRGFGDYYILAYVMTKWAYRMHFEDLMTRVNALISKAEIDVEGRTFRQMSKKESLLQKKLFFFPGLHGT